MKTVPKEKFKPVSVRYEKKKHVFWAYAKTLVMRSLGKRRIRVVVTYDNKERGGEPHFYCSNEIQWDSYKVLSMYARRWRIDAFYRDAKQNLGLEDYEMRKLSGARRHLAMVFASQALLVLGSAFVPVEEETRDGAVQIAAATSSSAKLVNNIKVAKAEACLSQTVGSRRRTIYIEALTSFLAFAIKLAGEFATIL